MRPPTVSRMQDGGERAHPSQPTELASRGPWRQAATRLRSRPLGLAALAVLVLFCLVGALAPLLAPYPAGRLFIELIQKPQPPLAAHHLLGTDLLSRDFLTQLLYAIRETVGSALVCVACATVVGVVVGAAAGYVGGWFDALVTWATGAIVAVPALAVLIIVSVWSRVPPSPLTYGLWLGALLWPSVARVVRATVASLQSREYVEAAYAAGALRLRVLVSHLLPNAAGSVIVAATSVVGQSIAVLATAEYLYYAYNWADRPTLGGLVADATHSASLTLTHSDSLGPLWWLYVFPAVTLVLLLLATTFLGDSLDEALNPQQATR
jgi:peptide/nickel transport system permease protein